MVAYTVENLEKLRALNAGELTPQEAAEFKAALSAPDPDFDKALHEARLTYCRKRWDLGQPDTKAVGAIKKLLFYKPIMNGLYRLWYVHLFDFKRKLLSPLTTNQ